MATAVKTMFPCFVRRSSQASWRWEGTSCWVRSWRSSWRTMPNCDLLRRPFIRPRGLTSCPTLTAILLSCNWLICMYLNAFALRGNELKVTWWTLVLLCPVDCYQAFSDGKNSGWQFVPFLLNVHLTHLPFKISSIGGRCTRHWV